MASVMFHLAGVDNAAFIEGVIADPKTYRDWSTGEWETETSGKEDAMYSPFLASPSRWPSATASSRRISRRSAGPGEPCTPGRDDLHESRPARRLRRDRPPTRDGLEIEGRTQAMLAINALHRYTPGCEGTPDCETSA